MNGWDLLVWVHVISAIIGIGPTFVMPLFLRAGQSRLQMKHSLDMLGKLELFPKIGGTIAVLSGISLAVFREYGSFLQLWLTGSLVLYILIQILVIGFVAPRTKKLNQALAGDAPAADAPLAAGETALTDQTRTLVMFALILGILLFSLMIIKP